MISIAFAEASAENTQKFLTAPTPDRDLAAYDAVQAKERAKFAQDLAAEYVPDLPAAVQELIFQQAWKDGIGSGYAAIENCYIKLAEFATKVHNA